MTKIIADINPKILVWARTEMRISADELAKKIPVRIDKYLEWEQTGKKIPLTALKELSKQCKRQMGVFFLPDLPKSKEKKPKKDFRNLSAQEAELSKLTALAMRRSSKGQHLAFELQGEAYWAEKYQWMDEVKKLRSETDVLAWLRMRLDVSMDELIGLKSIHEAYKLWRARIEEKLSILTMQYSMPIDEVQGYCYSDSKPYCIIVNSRHSTAGKIFTLFHELAHIIKHQSGICTPEAPGTSVVEVECNKFAGEFLLPAVALRRTTVVDTIYEEATRVKVSSEVYARRLLEAKLINRYEFNVLLEAIKKRAIKKKVFGRATPKQKSKSAKGELLYNMTVEAALSNRITYTRAADVLNLSIKYIIS